MSPEGPARHLNASWQKLPPHCLAAAFDSQLPSPKLSLKCPPPDISMSRAKDSLPVVPRQFLSLSYPRWDCPWNCPSNCPLGWFDPWKYAIWGHTNVPQIVPGMPSLVRVIERQDRGKNCPAAIFTPRQPDVSLGPLGPNSICLSPAREGLFPHTKYRPYGKCYLPITYCFRINFPKVTDTDTDRKLFWN